MPACKECGAHVALDENFCGSCGARLKSEEAADSAAADADLSKSLGGIGSSSWGRPSQEVHKHSGTGEIDEPEVGATSRAGEESPRRAKPKALAGGKVLNQRPATQPESGGCLP